MMLNATFNIILGISWQSVLLVGETRVPGENDTDKLYHIILYRVHLGVRVQHEDSFYINLHIIKTEYIIMSLHCSKNVNHLMAIC
jgi:hypothetical protein